VCNNGLMPNSRYRSNAGAVFTLKYHLVWCSKYRKPLLVGDVAVRLKELVEGAATAMGSTIHALEIMPDHVHIFVESDPTRAPAHIARQFKGLTSRILRQEFPMLRSRLSTLWSRSYYIGTVGHVSAATIQRYIENQKGR